VLVDHRSGDDAGVYRLDAGVTLVQTVDFFTPVVDDPEAFGAIAAANALSDVYAMGGRPLTALSIACFPERDFPPEWAAAIVRGGHAKLRDAGCVLLGGHSVRDAEIKFGYAVTGVVDPDALITNAGARAGDALVLTKPLGTGVIATALKAGQAPADVVASASASMARLNASSAAAAGLVGVRGGTDITGFGLVGHAAALARESGVTLEFSLERLPLLPGVLDLAPRFQPGGLRANAVQFGGDCAFPEGVDERRRALSFDPQTSGGLLLSVPAARVEELLRALPESHLVGRVRARERALVVFTRETG
jgi:selenide,water dikinase